MINRWLPILLILTLLAGAYLAGLHQYLTLSNLIQQREALGSFINENLVLAVAGYMALYVVIVAISFPGGAPLTIFSGLLFGWFIGGIATVTAATIGAIIIFLIARSSLSDILEQKAGAFVKRMSEGFRKDAFQYLLTLRLVPAFPFWVVNIVPGLLNMKLGQYALATFIGIIPGTFAFAYLGAGLDSVIREQEQANPGCAQAGTCSLEVSSLVTFELLLALAGLGILSFLPFIIRKLRGKPPANNNSDPVTPSKST
ncbi:MAG: TVP38/TMEM64 family protein [Pseudomonadota bacterium]